MKEETVFLWNSLKMMKTFLSASTLTLLLTLGAPASFAQDTNLEDRVAFLEDQVRELTGRLEESQHTIKQLKQGAQMGAHDAEPVLEKDKPLSAVKAEKERDPDDTTLDTAMADEKDDDDEAALDAPAKSPQEAYDYALALLNEKEYARADAALTKFIKAHPNHALVVNAQYWIGETHLLRKEYKQAALHFAKAYKTYKTTKADVKTAKGKQATAKAPEALVKLAISLKALGKKKEASATLAQLHKEFPQLPKNIQRMAERAQAGM
ncbi:MAG: hypothetical protein C0514_02750 [Candidatus Puniceispirillum sp.]|nr:hypothetical protein [Candidatus Puniceispirillum sp.]